MIILTKYDIEPTSEQFFYIRSKEHVSCPCCHCQLKIIGSRKRKYFNKEGKRVTLIIRRLRCKSCNKIHHELPDILVPYKRYESDSIENTLDNIEISSVAAEESTIYRWKKWYKDLYKRMITYFLLIPYTAEISSRFSDFINILSLLKKSPKWLPIIVSQLVNLALW